MFKIQSIQSKKKHRQKSIKIRCFLLDPRENENLFTKIIYNKIIDEFLKYYTDVPKFNIKQNHKTKHKFHFNLNTKNIYKHKCNVMTNFIILRYTTELQKNIRVYSSANIHTESHLFGKDIHKSHNRKTYVLKNFIIPPILFKFMYNVIMCSILISFYEFIFFYLIFIPYPIYKYECITRPRTTTQ